MPPAAPSSVYQMIRHDSESGLNDAETGLLPIDGIEVEANFNVAFFTVNPHTKNLKIQNQTLKSYQEDLTMIDIRAVAFNNVIDILEHFISTLQPVMKNINDQNCTRKNRKRDDTSRQLIQLLNGKQPKMVHDDARNHNQNDANNDYESDDFESIVESLFEIYRTLVLAICDIKNINSILSSVQKYVLIRQVIVSLLNKKAIFRYNSYKISVVTLYHKTISFPHTNTHIS